MIIMKLLYSDIYVWTYSNFGGRRLRVKDGQMLDLAEAKEANKKTYQLRQIVISALERAL